MPPAERWWTLALLAAAIPPAGTQTDILFWVVAQRAPKSKNRPKPVFI